MFQFVIASCSFTSSPLSSVACQYFSRTRLKFATSSFPPPTAENHGIVSSHISPAVRISLEETGFEKVVYICLRCIHHLPGIYSA
ncbi:uncharacterized protein BDZ99DRAFT_298079 [Mytilinidion resinicola]|uniref:Uncharacterized protein n=1 Tax=Mytilinidion resinicola TaxID=574789 RepID=A0A6A6YR29_9PEZI|nr:uncharacterized protein BDZ99DRAFT_298079 [Mytilinidion resinicola]KAF2811221.1 hypothetical protein BDZ99DRAFT_298079 [Mytilinidion resinicola]